MGTGRQQRDKGNAGAKQKAPGLNIAFSNHFLQLNLHSKYKQEVL